MYRRAMLVLVGAVLAMVFIGTGFSAEQQEAWVDRSSIQARTTDEGLQVRCSVRNPSNDTVSAVVKVRIEDLDGKEISRGERTIDRLKPLKERAKGYLLTLPGEIADEKIPLCVLKYELNAGKHSEKGSRSLIACLAQLETRVVAYKDLLAGFVQAHVPR